MQTGAAAIPAESFHTPAWVQDAVFYQIFPDRFAESTSVRKPSNLEPWESPPTIYGFKGGDLAGVMEHLDYLQDLGITAIYFCPIFASTANHRYHTYDYFNIDPILGGNEAFVRLLDEAHRRSIRVVLDGVFNHASRGFYQFNHILENGKSSPYIDWFTTYSWPLHPYGPAYEPAGYEAWWGDRALPKFNTNTLEVREFLWNVAVHWVERGIDGWRLDVPNEIDDDDFWRAFRGRVKVANPEAYIVGEIWGDARRWLAGDQFDAVMNYMFTRACLGFFCSTRGIETSVLEGTGLYPVDSLDAPRFNQVIDDLLGLYPWPATLAQLNLLDSHDTARFLTVCRGDETALRLAMLFQMTFPGAPCTFYGDEIGMSGGETVEDARRGFIWDASRWNHGLRDNLKSCIALRHAHPVLRRGGYETLYADDGLYVFSRRLQSDLALVALNVTETERIAEIDLPSGTNPLSLKQEWGSASIELPESRIARWRLQGRSGSVLIGRTDVWAGETAE